MFEVEGHAGGWRQWLAYDSRGAIRLDVGMNNRDVDDGLLARLEAKLDEFENRDGEREA
ncbi:MAG: hypothetical protein M3P26_15760 [Gemmatimonadota bacterium]|nr:hypothetical protein [Gemmatimonadota bacterium]